MNTTTQHRLTPPARRLVTVVEASVIIGCSTRTIRRYIATGRLRGYRVGPQLVRVDVADVEALAQPIPTAGGAA